LTRRFFRSGVERAEILSSVQSTIAFNILF
jgi:hypothetical protein